MRRLSVCERRSSGCPQADLQASLNGYVDQGGLNLVGRQGLAGEPNDEKSTGSHLGEGGTQMSACVLKYTGFYRIVKAGHTYTAPCGSGSLSLPMGRLSLAPARQDTYSDP